MYALAVENLSAENYNRGVPGIIEMISRGFHYARYPYQIPSICFPVRERDN